MTYCNICEKGARPLFEIVIYRGSALEELHLSGNHLKDEGIIQLMRGLSCAKTLKRINVADNQFYDSLEVLDAFERCMTKNETLTGYDIRHNYLGDDGIYDIVKFLEAAKHI